MNAIIYLLQVSACMAIFYGFYYFMLNRLTFFTINRFYLLFSLLLSFIIPLLTIHIHQPEAYPAVMQQVVYVNTLQNLPHTAPTVIATAPAVVEQHINWMQLLKIVYWLVAGGLFVQLLMVLLKFFTKLKYNKVNRVGNINILRGSKLLPNGSFLNYIFLNDDELSADELQQILAHEMLHIKFMHTVDRIIAKIAQIILWFNPFVYLYVRSIEENHEFEVDREVARSTDKGYYAELLLHLSVAQQGMLYHNFSKVPLKKRISMLFGKPSKKTKRIIYILIIPVIAISCLAFAKLKSDDKKPVDKKLYSVIDEIDNAGKNPKVLIDGKAYPKDILYKIGSGCILKSDVLTGGNYPPDGLVKITTRTGKITYMTAYEKETLAKIAAIPKSQLYTRITLKRPDGKAYDKVMIQTKGGSASSDIHVNGKVGFLIKNKLYSENDFKKLSPKVKDSLFNTTSLGAGGGDWLRKMGYKNDFRGYDAILRFIDPANLDEKKYFDQMMKKYKTRVAAQLPIHQYTVFGRSESLGKDPLVLIDGKEYPAAILYSISESCLNGWSSGSGNAAEIKKYGPRAKERVINIRTKSGKIILMTQAQKQILKENSDKEAAVPLTQFYTKLVLKKDDGKPYDKIIIHSGGGSVMTSSTDHGAKVAFFIDGKRYTEDAIKKLSPKFIATFGEGGVNNPKTHPEKWPNVQDCESVVYFTTSKVDPKSLPSIPQQKKSAKLETPAKVNQSIAAEPTKIGQSVSASQFYARVPLKKQDGSNYDQVSITRPGGRASADIPANGKVGFIIDDKVYNEDDFKKILPTIVASLIPTTSVGSFKSFRGFDLQSYNAVFKFQTLTTSGIIEYPPNLFRIPKNAVLAELLRVLPGTVVNADGSILFCGETVSNLTLNSKKYEGGDVKQAIQALPIGMISNVQFVPLANKTVAINIISDQSNSLKSTVKEYDVKNYTVKEKDSLGKLLEQLPNIKIDDHNHVFYNDKEVKSITVNNELFANDNTVITLISFYATVIDKVQVINVSDKPLAINLQLKPGYRNSTNRY